MKILLLGVLLCTFTCLDAQTLIVENNLPKAYVVLTGKEPAKVNDQLLPSRQETARMLIDYIKYATGATLPLDSGNGAKIELTVQQLPGMDIEGFRIDFPDDKTIRLTGASLRGLQYAVQEFLERYVGVRWLFPGKLGTEVPKHKTLAIPRKPVAQNPSMLRRLGTGGKLNVRPDITLYYKWMVKQRGSFHTRHNATHNFWNLIPVAKYGKSNPEFFPVYNGKRYIPQAGYNIWWNHCLTAPGIVEAAVANISESAKVVSMGANDGGKFCECANCLKIDSCKPNYVGRPHRSQTYIEFCARVAAKRPDVHFGASAYSDTIDPPENIKLPPNLSVTFAIDTHMFTDPALKADFMKIVNGWKACMQGYLGWHEYIYGNKYTLPRIYTRTLANNVKELYNLNVRYLESEYYPNGDWHDAIKAYVFFRTAWDINSDTDALIKDWGNAAVGKDAAPYLIQYFDLIEKFWTSPEVRKTDWFAKSNRTYLKWLDSSYLDALDPEMIGEMEKLLRKTVELAAPGKQKERAEYFLKGFLEFKPKLEIWKKNQLIEQQASQYNFNTVVAHDNFNKRKLAHVPSHWQRGRAKCRFFIDPKGGINNSQALAVNAKDSLNMTVCWLLNFKVKPNQLYKLSFWTRWENMTPGCAMNFSIAWRTKTKWLDSSYNVIRDAQAGEHPMQWHKRVFYAVSPPEEGALLIFKPGVTKAVEGTLWIDDVTLETMNYTLDEMNSFLQQDYSKVVYREDFNRPRIIYQQAGRDRAKTFRDENAGINNTPCLRSESNRGSLVNFIDLKTPGKYKISGFYRGSAAKVTAAFQQNRKWLSSKLNIHGIYPASKDWKEFTLYINRPEGENVRIALMLTTADENGKIWFDDIKISTVNEVK